MVTKHDIHNLLIRQMWPDQNANLWEALATCVCSPDEYMVSPIQETQHDAVIAMLNRFGRHVAVRVEREMTA